MITASKLWDVLHSVAHLVPEKHSMYQAVQDALDAGAKEDGLSNHPIQPLEKDKRR